MKKGKTATFAELAGTFPKRRRAKPATLEEIEDGIGQGAVARYLRSVSGVVNPKAKRAKRVS